MGQPVIRHTVEDNVAVAADLVVKTQVQGAELLLLPELFLSGYRPEEIGERPRRWAVTLDDPRLAPLVAAVEKAGVAVALGAALNQPDGLHNAVLWFRADGSVEHVYSKIHLWTSERSVFVPGDRQAVVDCHGLRLGIGICYDAGFPEFARAYARIGVDAILFSSAFASGPEKHRYHIYHQARALENGAYVAVANCVGGIGSAEFFGRSQVFDREGSCRLDVAAYDQFGVTDLDPRSAEHVLVPYLEHLRPINIDPDRFEG